MEEGSGRSLMDVNDAAAKAVRLVEPTIRKCTEHFTVHYAAPLPLVWGNTQRIEQVIVNLVLNACQALPDRDRAVVLEVGHDVADRQVVLTVRDEGAGIAPEHLPHLTDPFFTTKRDAGGTGLGLSVSAGILKEYGATLSFHSVPGRGTKAMVAFPVANVENAA